MVIGVLLDRGGVLLLIEFVELGLELSVFLFEELALVGFGL